MKQLIFICIIILEFSCTDYGVVKNDHQNDYKNRCKIEFLGKKEVPADDETSVLSNYIQFVDTKKMPNTFAALNEYSNSIYYYDYDSLKIRTVVHYEKEGANGVGLIQGFCYLNPDSIFVFCENMQTVYLTNEKAQVKWRKLIPAQAIGGPDFMPALPYLQTTSPLKYVDNKLVMQGGNTETLYETATNSPITSIYDIEKDTVFFANNYPEQYYKYNWGDWAYKFPYYDLNERKKLLVISFPQDHFLYVYSIINGECLKYYAGSRLIKRINAYDEKKEFIPYLNDARIKDWYYSNPSYRTVIYDKYRRLYYRIGLLPREEKMKGFYNMKPSVLIVLDDGFNYLGEALLPDDVDLWTTECFVSKEGLNIQVLTDDEDFYTFYQFKVRIEE
jgi:hypothetical protein bfra3_15608